jgi:hypothetical protein
MTSEWWAITAAAATLLFLLGWEAAHHFYLRTYERVAATLRSEHPALRKRVYQNIWRDMGTWEAVVKCELSRGWAWVRVKGIPPRRGVMPIENHLEQMGWAWTKWGARRRMRRTPPIEYVPLPAPAGFTRPRARR